MRQEFHGTAQGQFSSRDIINIHNLSQKNHDDKPLLVSQRQRLHQLLDDIVAISGKSKKDLWIEVHAHIDVHGIHDITTRKYHQAEEYLLARQAEAKNVRECKRLVGEILRITVNSKARDRFCLRKFGTKTLNDLSREQLQTIFDYFARDDDFSQKQQKIISWIDILKNYPKLFICVFLLGFLLSFLIRV